MVIKKKPYLVKIFNVEDLLQYFDGPEDLCAAYLDFILPRVSKRFPILTPAPTPDRNSKPAVTDLDFNLAYQNDWKVGSCREIDAFIYDLKPPLSKDWTVNMCTECFKYTPDVCSCNGEKKTRYLLALHLKSRLESKNVLTAFISGDEADQIFQLITPEQLLGYVKDNRAHRFEIYKFIPEQVTISSYGFLVSKIKY